MKSRKVLGIAIVISVLLCIVLWCLVPLTIRKSEEPRQQSPIGEEDSQQNHPREEGSQQNLLWEEYSHAQSLFIDGQFLEAIHVFEKLQGFSDSERMAELAKTKYHEAQVKETEPGATVLWEEYSHAQSLFIDGLFLEAIHAFEELQSFSDSERMAELAKTKYHEAQLKETEPGATVLFGHYEQDNDTSNGDEDIEWIVLDKDIDRVLVISKYGLDHHPAVTLDEDYEDNAPEVTWLMNEIRTWLNTEFLNAAFNLDERNMIQEVPDIIESRSIPFGDLDVDGVSFDYLFLLTETEVSHFISEGWDPRCVETDYSHGWHTDSYCNWLLRTPGYCNKCFSFVGNDGQIRDYYSTTSTYGAIRPAMWIYIGD